jgi:signal transduction histidine kinase
MLRVDVMKRRERGISVGRRLSFLVAAEVATALALVIVGLLALQGLASGSRFLHQFILVPIHSINVALDDVIDLGDYPRDAANEQRIARRLGTFVDYYRNEIQVAGNPRPDARRQAAQLQKAGRLDLVADEQRAIASLEQDVERLPAAISGPGVGPSDVDALRTDLRRLLRINEGFVNVAQADINASAARMRTILVAVGLCGIFLAGALAWHVRRAIAPRVSELVDKVKRFQEYGVLERSMMRGHDDIAVLANALDVGFAAIAERNLERERFLAVAAHELKTPMVSILGFIQAALTKPEQRERALVVIRRQTRRLGHLVEDLLWAANVRAGKLPFHPIPLDLAEVARKMATEVEDAVPSHPIVTRVPDSVHLLVDETLVTHALWSLLTYAGALSATNAPIDLGVEPSDAHVLVTLQIRGPTLPPEDEVRLFDPFSTIQYEVDTRPRSAMGLFLCREIARVHGGSLRVSERSGVGPLLTLDLPA